MYKQQVGHYIVRRFMGNVYYFILRDFFTTLWIIIVGYSMIEKVLVQLANSLIGGSMNEVKLWWH